MYLNSRLYISTISDIAPDLSGKGFVYSDKTASLAARFDLGLELTEYCISENLDNHHQNALLHFENNLNSAKRVLFHAPFNELYPHAIDRKVSQVAFDRYSKAITLCESSSIPKMVVHANYIGALYHPDWFVSAQVSFWERFLDSHPGNTVICLENVLEPHPDYLLRIVSSVNDPRLRICLDIGHANLSPFPATEWFDKCLPFLSHMHLHNNNGPTLSSVWPGEQDTHSPLQSGTIPMDLILNRFSSIPTDITATLETNDPELSLKWLADNNFITVPSKDVSK